MARPTTLMTVALATAAVAGLLPQFISAGTPAAASSIVSPGSTTGVAASAGADSTGSLLASVDPVKVVRPAGGTQPLLFERTWLAKDAERMVLFRNENSATLTVELVPDVVVLDREGRKQTAVLTNAQGKTIDPFEMKGNTERILTLRVSPSRQGDFSLPATGFLKITSKQDTKTPKPVFQEITIPEGPYPGTAGIVFLLCLLTAAILVIGTVIRLRSDRVDLLRPMGDPAWTSGKSWGVNLAIGATLVTALLTLGFPEHPWLMTKASFSLLLGVFAALVGMAPLIYGLFQSEVQVQVKDSAGASVAGIDRQGNVLLFLLAGGLILWGALGGAIMLLLLLLEFFRDGFIDPLVGGVLLLLAGFICLLLVLYGWRALYRTAKHPGIAGEAPPQRQAQAQVQAPSLPVGAAVPAAAQATLSGPVPKWPLL